MVSNVQSVQGGGDAGISPWAVVMLCASDSPRAVVVDMRFWCAAGMQFPKYPGTEIADCMAQLKALEQSIDKDIEASKPELARIETELAKLEQMDVRRRPPCSPLDSTAFGTAAARAVKRAWVRDGKG